MPTVDEDLDASRALLGTVETPAGSNHNFITDWYADRVGDDGFRHAPWCAMSRSYTFDHAGGDLSYAYCPFIERDARAGRNGLAWLAMNAEVGAWVLFDFDGHGQATHVGHVEAINSDGTLITLEGNTGDAYRRQHRDLKYVHGFVRPPFDATAPKPFPSHSPKTPEHDMTPATVSFKGHRYSFVVGTDRQAYVFTDGKTDSLELVGGLWTSGLAALDDGDAILLSGRGNDGALWESRGKPGGGVWVVAKVGGSIAS